MFSSRQKFSLATLILCLFVVPVLRAQPDMQAVKHNIRQRLDEGDILGISIAYIKPDGDVLYYSAGFLSTEKKHPVTKNTIFEIGSVSKTFTSLILARMVLQHKVALNDPINKFLPDSLHVPSWHGQKITLEELATHTSGLPRMPSNFPLKNHMNPYVNYTVHDLYEFLDHYKLTRKPGTHFLYSNLGVGLLGTILAKESGMTYAQLLHKYITGPLQMNDTELRVPKAKRNRFADPYKYGKPVHHWNFLESFAGAGGIRSTAKDLAIYMKAQMGLKETSLDSAIALTHKIRFHNSKHSATGLLWAEYTSKGTPLFGTTAKQEGFIVLQDLIKRRGQEWWY